MTIRDWPRTERPREKLLEGGAHTLSDGELLAVLLGSGLRGHSAVEIARGLIQEFGSLRDLLTCDAARCLSQRGIGPARYSVLQASVELARRHFRESLRVGPALSSHGAIRAFVLAQLRDHTYEVFCCLYLDRHERLIVFQEMFRGTVGQAHVHPREVVREALLRNAAYVVFAHNHPAGPAEPSQGDEVTTRRLKDALALVDVQVVDHLVVGHSECVSFVERGLL